jgi:hypothetical protein
LALAWNDLHERLGSLFYFFIDKGDDLGSRLWNAPQFDRPKRALLEAVTQSISSQTQLDYPRLKDDILWLLKQVDSLEDGRNTVIHSPLLAEEGILANQNVLALGNIFDTPRAVMPNLWLKNTRATRLAQKDVLTEFRWCRDAALILRDYALTLDYATMPEECPWPDRPSLPNRGQKRTRRSRRPPSPPK